MSYLWVDVEYLSVALVFEHDAAGVLGNNLIVGRVVRRDHLVLPVEEAQVGWLWQQLSLARKVRLKVFGLESMSVVDVARYLLVLVVPVADKNNRLPQQQQQQQQQQKSRKHSTKKQ